MFEVDGRLKVSVMGGDGKGGRARVVGRRPALRHGALLDGESTWPTSLAASYDNVEVGDA